MNADELKARQAPLKRLTSKTPAPARPLSASGELAPGEQTVTIRTPHTTLRAGSASAAGGSEKTPARAKCCWKR